MELTRQLTEATQDVWVASKVLSMVMGWRSTWSQFTASFDEHWTSIDGSLSGCPHDLQVLPPKANRNMLKQEIATEDAFLDRTSVLILAEDWFGKWMEKFLKVCNR